MSILENENVDKKSLRKVIGKTAGWNNLAKDCVCFANGKGGKILIGIEDDETLPPKDQKISEELILKIQKTIPQLTINVATHIERKPAENGGEYIELTILPNKQTIASTSDGRYFIRISDNCQPVLPDELSRLASEKNAFIWEFQTNKKVSAHRCDPEKLKNFIMGIRNSERVSEFIKEKTDEELLDHYFFKKDSFLTNLGILWIGTREDRASLLYAPSIQFVKYDQYDQKIRKEIWDDYSLNPIELLDAVVNTIPEWNESFEIPDGIFRTQVPIFEKEVVRELVANALAHRLYTMRGDIYS